MAKAKVRRPRDKRPPELLKCHLQVRYDAFVNIGTDHMMINFRDGHSTWWAPISEARKIAKRIVEMADWLEAQEKPDGE